MKIIEYSRVHRLSFKKLNEEWLEKYFNVEPYDSTLLENCESEIINKGGYIFFGIIDNEVMGTYALLPPVNGRTELGKWQLQNHTKEKVWSTITKTCTFNSKIIKN